MSSGLVKLKNREKTMADKTIYNCHTHIFTHESVPNGYFPFFLVPAARIAPIRWLLRGAMKLLVPWTDNDRIHRYAAFIKAIYRKSQENNLTHLMGYYPENTKFIVLPMDMAYMHAGEVKEDIDEQQEELVSIASKSPYKDLVIPFAHVDPRRKNSLQRLKHLVEEHNFRGVKIYPTLGYYPYDNRLMDEIYPYMVEKNIPLMAHCSRGSVYTRNMSPEEAYRCAEPYTYTTVLEAFPDLRICLAHFGGIREWRRHIDEPRNTTNPTWLAKIRELITSGKYPNLFTDISHTIFNFQENVPLLKILLEDEQTVEHVLFGSDFYMVESEKYSEKRFSIDLRSTLGEEKFWTIANTNPMKYLGI